MKKLSIIFSLLLASSTYLSAQNVVNGTVVDHDGNPIPGVKVEIVGGTESVITELDGSFNIETQAPAKKVKIVYAGMQTKLQKIKPDMTIKMHNSSWWYSKPEKYQWFVGAQLAVPDIDNFTPAYGLMFGRVKDFGWYVKGVFNAGQSGDYDVTEKDGIGNYWHTDKLKMHYYSCTGGVVVRLWSPIYVCLGGGYASRTVVQELAGGEFLERVFDGYECFAIDLGIMMGFNKVFVSGGVTINNDGDVSNNVGNFGVGLYF